MNFMLACIRKLFSKESPSSVSFSPSNEGERPGGLATFLSVSVVGVKTCACCLPLRLVSCSPQGAFHCRSSWVRVSLTAEPPCISQTLTCLPFYSSTGILKGGSFSAQLEWLPPSTCTYRCQAKDEMWHHTCDGRWKMTAVAISVLTSHPLLSGL